MNSIDKEMVKTHDLAINYVRATRHQLDLIERWLDGQSTNAPTMGAFSQDAVRLAECMARYGALVDTARMLDDVLSDEYWRGQESMTGLLSWNAHPID